MIHMDVLRSWQFTTSAKDYEVIYGPPNLREAFPLGRRIRFREPATGSFRYIEAAHCSFPSRSDSFAITGYGYGRYTQCLRIQACPEEEFGFVKADSKIELVCGK